MKHLNMFSHKQLQIILLILVLTAFCTGLLAYRIQTSGYFTYYFLIWNLFLAFIPYGASLVITNLSKPYQYRLLEFSLLGIWLLFLPNSFYIITDLFHLKPRHNIPLWFDLILLLSFALNGLLAGYLSIIDIHDWIEIQFGKPLAWFSSVTTILLCAFGVYLGRYLRWNSWDILSDPFSLFYDILDRFLNPLAHTSTWGMTLSYGAFFLIIFLFFRILFDTTAIKSMK